MRKRFTLAIAFVALASLGLAAMRSHASDHRDGTATTTDPATDIADVYAFMRPLDADGGAPETGAPEAGPYAKSDHLVLVMTVFPSATGSATFDPRGEFLFNVAAAAPDVRAGDVDPTIDVLVACRFQPAASSNGTQPFICSVNGFFFAGNTDELAGADSAPLRVFAGRRADPAFGAANAAMAAVASGSLPDASNAADDFSNDNVLAIVAEIDVDRVVFGDAGRRPLAVSATVGRFQ